MKNDISVLKQMIDSGVYPRVRFTKTAEDIDWRWEEGMLGYAVAINMDGLDCKIVVEEREFSEYNKTLEKYVWFGDGNEQVPYSQTRFYKNWTGVETVIESGLFHYYFELTEDTSNGMFAEYLATGCKDKRYVQWLEEELAKARGSGSAAPPSKKTEEGG